MSGGLALCYHAISERWPAALSITPGDFAAQIRLLVRRGYRGVTFSDLAADDGAGAVAITFDDAYRSVLEIGLPILREVGYPATLFAPTAWIGRNEPMSWPGIDRWLATEHRDELLPMSWPQLQELASEGWEIGSHTISHPRLPELDDAMLATELGESRAEIERHLGSCRTIAYPYGEYDARVMAATEEAGYSVGGTLWGSKPSGGGFDYPRAGIYHADSLWRFRLKMSPLMRRVRVSSLWSRASGLRGTSATGSA